MWRFVALIVLFMDICSEGHYKPFHQLPPCVDQALSDAVSGTELRVCSQATLVLDYVTSSADVTLIIL
jgi:hypothetical protein